LEDDEIIIGINPKKNSNKTNKKKTKTKRKNKSKTNIQENSKSSKLKKKRTNTTIAQKNSQRIIKIITILILIIIFVIFLLSTSLFNIKTINVFGNNKISDNKIISLSSLELYTNIFRFKKSKIVESIKQNAYIESVKITRKYPNTVNIDVVEREVRYMLQFADSYVYINNQGYMLDISNEKLEVPILVGFTTDLSNIKAGNRINIDDLEKMNTVIKIYEVAKSNELNELITKIDISNSKNYTIEIESEGKIIYLGECIDYSDLKNRMIYLKSILEACKGKNGEIFLNVDLNSEKIYFREKI